jgi:hypothetical protein
MKTGRCVRCPRTNGAPLLGSRLMGKRRADATGRRFTDEFPSVRVSRFRANGTIDPGKRTAIIAFPDGSTKLIGTAHTHLKYNGGWSYFICSGCAKLAQTLDSIDGKPLCWRCCEKLNIRHRGKWGMGREERLRAADQQLDRIIAKLETTKPPRLNGAPASWGGKAQLIYRSRRLTERMRRSMITLRLSQLASQHAVPANSEQQRSCGHCPPSSQTNAASRPSHHPPDACDIPRAAPSATAAGPCDWPPDRRCRRGPAFRASPFRRPQSKASSPSPRDRPAVPVARLACLISIPF